MPASKSFQKWKTVSKCFGQDRHTVKHLMSLTTLSCEIEYVDHQEIVVRKFWGKVVIFDLMKS